MRHTTEARLLVAVMAWGAQPATAREGTENPAAFLSDPLRSLGALEADFVARNPRGEERRGRWAFRLKPSYAQRIEFKTSVAGEFTGDEAASFDSATGEGRQYSRRAGTLRGTATIGLKPPGVLGYSWLPSDPSFFFAGMRPLADFFELCRPQVIALEGPGDEVAVLCRYPATSSAMLVYFFRRSLAGVVAEQRLYLTRDDLLARRVSLSRLRRDLARPIPLPGGFGPACLFSVKTVLETRDVGDVTLPVKWRVQHALGTKESDVTISLIPETVRLNQSLERYRVDFPPGTRVRDFTEGKDYYLGQGGEEHASEVVTGAALSEILKHLRVEGGKNEPEAADHETSCAANALYVLLALCGKAPRFEEVSERLGVEGRGALRSLVELRQAARASGIPSATVVRDAQDLVYREGAGPAVAHIVWRSKGGKERPHYVVVDHYDRSSDTVRVTDVPRIPYRVKRDHFEEVWGGYALVVGRAAEEAMAAAAFRRRALWAAGAALLGLAGAVALFRHRRGKRFHGPGSLVALGSVCLLLGCDGAAGEHISPAASVLVVGPAEVDLGRVRWRRGDAAGWTFRLRNVSRRSVAIDEIKTSRSCLAARASAMTLEAGGEADVELKLKSGLVSGKQEAWCLVTFEQAQPVSLRVKAVVERDYTVVVMPLRWVITADERSAGVVRRTFLVREFCDWDTSGSQTEVSVSGEGVTLERVGPWRPVGERIYGFARESEITLSYRLPEPKCFEERILFRFRCETPRGGTEGPEVREDERSVVVQG